MQLIETFERVKRASKSLALLSDEQRNEILLAVADAIINSQERILNANAQDLAKMEKSNPLYDRLQLTESRFPHRRSLRMCLGSPLRMRSDSCWKRTGNRKTEPVKNSPVPSAPTLI